MGASFIFGLFCIGLPILAWICLSYNWEFNIPYIGVIYKPWRLFILICGLPGLFCTFLLLFIPESPKYVLLEGKEKEAIAILKSIFIRNGKGKLEDWTV